MPFRLILLLLSLIIWTINGLYAVYINHLKLLQYKYTQELRKLRRENDELYLKIYQHLNFEKALEYAKRNGFVPVKPYRVVNFKKTLEGKPLIDFYLVWFNDTLSKIARKTGVELKELKKFNPSTRWGYVIPGQRLKIPLKGFPYILKSPSKEDKNTDKNSNKTNNLVPGKSQVGNGRGNPPQKLQQKPFRSVPD